MLALILVGNSCKNLLLGSRKAIQPCPEFVEHGVIFALN